jgi:hypothetical protein
MDNFFESYINWIIFNFNGENINDILNSGYTANTGTYYCPECSPYILSSVNELIQYASVVGYETFSACCLNFTASIGKFIIYSESSGTDIINSCCTQDKFCLESNLSNISPGSLLSILASRGVVELGSSSEIYNTNLCYLFEQLYSAELSNFDILNIFVGILDNGIVIWCYEGIIYANSVQEYLSWYEAVGPGYTPA